ncbi:MAG: hypothetical protein J6T03_04830 [Bacteroidales bacterium]|nr:hypothetical protein [Bacteroidales bacterium]
MSEDEITQIRTHVDYGLARAEWCMLKEKALRNDKVVTLSQGKPCAVSARYLYRKLYGNTKEFPSFEKYEGNLL